MKKIISSMIIICLLGVLVACDQTLSEAESKQVTDAYIVDFTENNFDAMIDDYEMTALVEQSVTAELFDQVWNQELIVTCGNFIKVDTEAASVAQASTGGYQITYELQFDYKNAYILVGVNGQGAIESFLLSGYESKMYKEVPTGVKTEEVMFGEDDYKVSGTVFYQDGISNGPCVIIIGGSGPNDRFGSVGGNQPYFDLAAGLADKGITVLIYDKRTYAYRTELSADEITINTEIIDDSVYAFAYMSSYATVNPEEIYYIGHSLGGYVLPMIDQAIEGKAAGYIFMAASSTSLEDLMLYQIKYLADLDGTVTEAEQTNIDLSETMTENVHALTEENQHQYASSALFNVPAPYWLSLQGYDPVEGVIDIDSPMLFLNGNRDYQVPLSEVKPYQQALSGRSDVRFVAFDGLNHLFLKGEGTPNPSEYYNISDVPDDVIRTIADFIHK